MDSSKKYCQNCGYELEEGSTICNRCNIVAALNLENFLLNKYKIFAIIGIFGALSVYLSTTASTHNNNLFLQSGSYISLSIVILLSSVCLWDLIRYSCGILEFSFDGNMYYKTWIKLGFRFSTILLFIVLFVSIIFFISLYILSDISTAKSLISVIFSDFFLFFCIAFFYFPFRNVIEMWGNIARCGMNFILILFLVYAIDQLFKGNDENFILLISFLPFIFIDLYLVFRSSSLIIRTMNNGVREITLENIKKKIKSIDLIKKNH